MHARSVIPSPGRVLAIQAPWAAASMRALLCMLCMCLLAAPAWAQKRMALVIGNGDYVHESRLNNPVNDARLIARTLRGLGFSVDERFNLGQRDMVLAINRFTRESSGADTALVYFAGHGMQPVEGGRNFLLPVDANIHHDDALDSDAVPADRIVEQMERAARPARLRLVVLDACRNNRQASRARSGVRGLARMEPSDDYTLIAFSTNDQSVALDGQGAHSPYAEALSRHLSRARELPVRRIFELTAGDVRQATGQQQRPRTYGDLDSRVGLDGVVMTDALLAAAPMGAPAAASQSNPPSGGVASQDAEGMAWDLVLRRDTAAGYVAYLQNYPQGRYAAAARVALETFRGAPGAAEASGASGVGQGATQTPQAAGVEAPRPQVPSLSASLPAVASSTVGPTAAIHGRQPGQVFRDCAECPEMVVIPAGRFLMGSPESEPGRDHDEGPQRWVDVPRFAIGKFEVTQGQWQAVMGDNPSRFKDCGVNCPVENVSWDDAQEFVRRLNQRTGQNYRLPSEAEWEYAARAGTTTAYPWGGEFNQNFANNNQQGPVQVGRYPANAFHLHDMHGNVWEWVQDVWDFSYLNVPSDGSAWTNGGSYMPRVLRGGSWIGSPQLLRSAIRTRSTSGNRNSGAGLRIASTL